MSSTDDAILARGLAPQRRRAYETIRTMPFNAELAAGTLSEARFKHYITQDAHYLIGFGRALTLAAAKAPYARSPDPVRQIGRRRDRGRARAARLVLRAIRHHAAGVQRHAAVAGLPSLCLVSCIAAAYAEPYEVLLGALLPCFWIYAEVGRDIHARAAPANPYQAWIDTYAGEQFHAAVNATIEATDEAAAGASPALRERMHRAFTRATQLEWIFWDSAYRLEHVAGLAATSRRKVGTIRPYSSGARG